MSARRRPAKAAAPAPPEPRDRVVPLALCAADAAHSLGISERTLWSMTQAGSIPHVRIGRRILYRRADLETWLARRAAASVRGRRSAD